MSSLQSILYIFEWNYISQQSWTERNRTSQQSCLDVEADNNVYSVNLHLFLAL